MKKSIILLFLSLIFLIGCSATFSSGQGQAGIAPEDSLRQDQNYQAYEDLLNETKEALEEEVLEPVISPDPSQIIIQ